MTWRIAVTHTTTNHYAQEVFSSYNEARITPLTVDRQLCLESRVEVAPSARLFSYTDYWGTLVHAFDLHAPHRSLDVVGHSIVETSPPLTSTPGLSWEALSAVASSTYGEYVAPTHYVPFVGDDVVSLFRSAGSPLDAARTVADWVRGRLSYAPGWTDVSTSALQALEGGRGVCQDFAHLCLAVLRELGIPGRYVSGYLHPNPDAGVGETVDGQGHAWVEWWCGSWMAWDPTHGVPVGERHVHVARGRDYADVPPLKGIYQGAPVASLEVGVQLTRVG